MLFRCGFKFIIETFDDISSKRFEILGRNHSINVGKDFPVPFQRSCVDTNIYFSSTRTVIERDVCTWFTTGKIRVWDFDECSLRN